VTGIINLCFLDGYAPSWAQELGPAVEEAFSRPVATLALDVGLKTFYAPERRQYHATLILARLLRNLPDPGSQIIGITSVDLFIPVLTFVFGQSQLDGPGAVISTYRLHNEFYGLPRDEGLLVERTIKEVLHELGHSFGLVHCPDYTCLMKAATDVGDVDLKGTDFCVDCRARLQENDRRRAAAGSDRAASGD
jgi:archaemetzincin